MSYDALVWLLVGLGVGVAGSLMLLLGYVTLEHRRLGRRLRRGPAAALVAPAVSTAIAKPAAAKRPELAAALPRPVSPKPVERESAEPKRSGTEPVTPVAASPVAAKAKVTIVPKSEPKAEAEGGAEADTRSGPARPALSLVSSVPPEPVVASDPALPAPQPAPAVPATPRPLQSVEAMFAEAFANDRLPVSPEPRDEAKPPKP